MTVDKDNIFTFSSEKRTPVAAPDLAAAEEVVAESTLRSAVRRIIREIRTKRSRRSF